MITEEKSNDNMNFSKCPFCPCCYCTEPDLQRHIEAFGSSKTEHYEAFRRVHARLEHGSFNGPE